MEPTRACTSARFGEAHPQREDGLPRSVPTGRKWAAAPALEAEDTESHGSRFLRTVYSTYRHLVTSGDDTYLSMADPLTTVKQATARRSAANASWREAIREAHAAGASLRQIAAAAGVSHVRILQVVRQRKAAN